MSASRRSSAVLVLAVSLGLMLSGCGGSPTQPPPPPPDPTPTNNAPVITAIAVQGTRQREPANFADVAETVNVTAQVRDDETPVTQLQYTWTSSVGTFTGTGASVTWQAPASVTEPTDVTLRLEVVERYGPASAPTSLEHRVSRTATVRVHDSVKEIAEMARVFLVEFSEQRVPPDQIVRNFREGCGANGRGKIDERNQVADNQRDYGITQWSVGTPRVTINFGGVCSFRARSGDACARADVFWRSTRLTAPREPTDPPKGSTGQVAGIDQVSAEYHDSRWWLCDSDFDGVATLTSGPSPRPFTFIK